MRREETIRVWSRIVSTAAAYIALTALIPSLSGTALARPPPRGEIAATPDMLTRAARTIPREDYDPPLEYHFRRSGELVMVCAYHGGNFGFCIRTPLSAVKRIDEFAEDECRHGGPNTTIPHVMTGEAIALNYDCKRGHMVREPYAGHFDADGWKWEEWRPLR
jgi:hypothetical protein